MWSHFLCISGISQWGNCHSLKQDEPNAWGSIAPQVLCMVISAFIAECTKCQLSSNGGILS